jgi:ubiquitin-like 1-activating enzyme E1 A
MRSSTVLILSLKSVAHEIIKNLVLAGIGRLIVMDDGVVTEDDLGTGFLFREEDGAVGQEVSLFSSGITIEGRDMVWRELSRT